MKDSKVVPSIIFALQILLMISYSTQNLIDYKSYNTDSIPKEIVFCGISSQVILVTTEESSVYRSEDKGFSWKKINNLLTDSGKQELEEHENEIGNVSEILLSPVDKNLVIFLGTHGINWVSSDCGRNIKALNHGRKIQEFIFHPTERNWVLASAYTLCEDFQNEPCKKFKEVFLTKDMGESWDLLLPYVVQFNWGITGPEHIKGGVPKERILVTYEPRGRGDQKHIGWNYKIDMVFSDDFFKTKRFAVHKGNKFLLTDSYLFVAQVIDQEDQEVILLVSSSKEAKYDFNPIKLPAKVLQEHSYTFLDTTEESVFLHINHFGDSSKFGYIYTSDKQGLKYSLSLADNVRSYDNQCDFDRLNGLEGIYIANTIDQQFIEIYKAQFQRESEDSMDEKKHSRSKEQEENAYRNFIRTLITFNKGGQWKQLNAPERDSEGHLYDCADECYLNLHGVSGDFQAFYSVKTAAGILLGNGNVGQFLSHEAEEVATFLSRDGGLSWIEVRKGPHIFEIGDHGGLIVVADDQKAVDEVYYSWNEGITFEAVKISDEKVFIREILIEPTSRSQQFLVYGETVTRKGKKKGIVIALDFASLNKPQCRNPDYVDRTDSDYEKWSPSDQKGHQCLLGKKTIYVRRKRDAECFNGEEFERKTVVENCDCTDFDYECDEGFARANIKEPCTPINTNTHKLPLEGEIHKPPENCKGYYTISKGYRKVPGNSCVNGVKFDPIIIPCPYTGLMNYLGILFFFIILVSLAVLVILSFNKTFIQSISSFVEEKLGGNKEVNNSISLVRVLL